MVQDLKRQELERLRTELGVAPPGEPRSEIQRKIAFAEAIIRMRDGTDRVED
jgi:hypothetical protein